MTERGLSVGLLVSHKKWGLGKVILLDSENVCVYFKDIEGTPKDAVKRLKWRVAVLTPATQQSDSALDNLPPMVRDGKLELPDTLRITEQKAVELFRAKFPLSFVDPEYRKHERDYKWEAHCRVAEELLSVHGRRIVAKEPSDALVNTLNKLIHRTNLLATQEIMALNDAFKDQQAARKFAEAVLKFVDENSEQAFSGLVEATGSLPAVPGRARVLTWPVVTILPFLAKPDCHMFLKPMQTQRVAKAFSFDLLYSPYPKWATYDRLLKLSDQLLKRLRPLGARDLIDVQSFMWVVEGSPHMKKVKRKR